MTARCFAYTPDGTICRTPAVGIDYEKGITVCAAHLAAYLDRVEASAGETTGSVERAASRRA